MPARIKRKLKPNTSYVIVMVFEILTAVLRTICHFSPTILYKTRWDTCATNHHYVHNQDVCVQNDMYDSISMF